MSNLQQIGENIADKLGHEETIVMRTNDARYRYYQWLRDWYGMGQQEATNKCPFYQFMFWGSLIMLVSIIPIILLKITEWVVLKPLTWVVPDVIDDIYKKIINPSKMIAAWLLTFVLFVVAVVITLFVYGELLYWIGFGILFVYAIPYAIIWAIGTGLVVVVTLGLPMMFTGIGIGFSYLFNGIGLVPWGQMFIYLGLGIAFLFVFLVLLVSIYQLTILLFESKFSNWVIKKSCIIRENSIGKNKERRERIIANQELKEQAQLKWNLEHKDELELERIESEARCKERDESIEQWVESIIGLFGFVWSGLKIFPGYPFIWAWLLIKQIGLGIWWVMKKIGDFCVIVWSLATETVSNHCPPIDFIFNVNDEGLLIAQRKYDGYVFLCENEERTIVIEELPDTFDIKPGLKDGLKCRIQCTICTKDVETAQYDKANNWSSVYESLIHPSPVYEIQSLEYVKVPKKRKSKKVTK